MVSEDSDLVVSGLPTVHRLHDGDDLDKSVAREVSPFGDQLHAAGELLEVGTLRRSQRVAPEEGYDHFEQVTSSANAVSA